MCWRVFRANPDRAYTGNRILDSLQCKITSILARMYQTVFFYTGIAEEGGKLDPAPPLHHSFSEGGGGNGIHFINEEFYSKTKQNGNSF